MMEMPLRFRFTSSFSCLRTPDRLTKLKQWHLSLPPYSRSLHLPNDSETKRIFEQRKLNCSFLLAVRSELLEEAPQLFGLLLVLDPRKHHFGARNLRLRIFDVF